MPVNNLANSDEKKRILIIEDNIESQLILKVYLRDIYLIDIAEDAEAGMELLKSNLYELMLLDINLPGKLNGEDVLKQVRADSDLKILPVIVITAYALKGDKERFLNQGASDYLSKPVEKQTLRDAIVKHLSI
jgi:two-component system, sensor histidine kinase